MARIRVGFFRKTGATAAGPFNQRKPVCPSITCWWRYSARRRSSSQSSSPQSLTSTKQLARWRAACTHRSCTVSSIALRQTVMVWRTSSLRGRPAFGRHEGIGARQIEVVERQAEARVVERRRIHSLAEKHFHIELPEPLVHAVERRPAAQHVHDQRQHAVAVRDTVQGVLGAMLVDHVEQAELLDDSAYERQVGGSRSASRVTVQIAQTVPLDPGDLGPLAPEQPE